MNRTSYLTHRRFVKTAGVFCATLAGTGTLSACASETSTGAGRRTSRPHP